MDHQDHCSPSKVLMTTEEELFKFVEQGEVNCIMNCSEANLMVKIEDGETLLHRAVSMNVEIKEREKVIKCLVLKAPQLTQATNIHGDTPLCHACKYIGVTNSSQLTQYLHLIRFLVDFYPSIETSAALNIANHHNITPLHYMMALEASYFSRSCIYNANSRKEYMPCSMWAVFSKEVKNDQQGADANAKLRDIIILSLLKKGAKLADDSTDVIMLARDTFCCFEVIEYLLEQNSNYDINTRNDSGSTILIQYGYIPPIIVKLLQLGADVSAVTYHGETVLSSAIRTPDIRMIKGLRELGAEVSPHDPLILYFICQIYWSYTSINDPSEWHELFKTVISLPSFQTPEVPTKLITLLEPLKALFRATHRSNIKDTLVAIVNYNPIKINTTFIEASNINGQTIMAEPIAYIISEFLSNKIITEVEQRNYLLEMSRMMLDAGFTVCNNPGNYCTAVTALLTIKKSKVTPDQENKIYTFIKELISRGANIESMSLNACDKEINLYKQDFCLPDALYMAFINDWKNILDLLLQYWWAPPLALLVFKKTMHLEEFISWYQYLSQYKFGIPHGTTLYSLFTATVEEIQSHALNYTDVKQLQPVIEHFQNMTNSPLSLLELSNFTVRQSLAKAAIKQDTSLPNLFKELLPIQLPTKLHNCITSENMLNQLSLVSL